MNQATTYFPTHLRAVSSALKVLTSGFGMVPGVAPSVLPPEFKEHSNNFNLIVNNEFNKMQDARYKASSVVIFKCCSCKNFYGKSGDDLF